MTEAHSLRDVSSKRSYQPLLISARPLQYKDYDEDKVGMAYEAVRKGISVRRAAEEYGIYPKVYFT